MYQDDYHNSYNSDADTTHGSINFHNESMTQVNRLEDGTLEITDTLPKKDYYMSLRKTDTRLGGSMSRIGGGSSNAFGTMTGTLRSGYPAAKYQSIAEFKPSGKFIGCLVMMLDGTEEEISVDRASFGQHLFDAVCDKLELNEREYFGISYKDRSKVWYWLDLTKKITKQVPDNRLIFEFQVKFYPPEISMVNEDLTRYYLSLQVRQDIVCGKLPCSFYVYTILASYIIQSEAGDYDPQNHRGIEYIKSQALAPQKFQTAEFMEKVVALHKLHRGQTPEEADKNFLDNTRKLSLYGLDMHKVKNSDGEEILMGVYYGGIVLYRQKIRIIRFSWARLIQVSYKKKKIIITVRGVNKNDTKKELTFKCTDIKLTKRAYKAVVDHHFFFRMIEFGIPKKPNLQPGFHTRKYYKTPTSGSPTTGGEFNYDRNPAPKIKRLQPARKEPTEDGWFTLPSKNGVTAKEVTTESPLVTSNTNHSTQYSPKGERSSNNINYGKAGKQLPLTTNERPTLPHLHWRMSPADCTLSLGMDDKGLDVASQPGTGWQGCRANKGVKTPGEYFYEARVLEDGLVRVGWSTNDGSLKVGTDAYGYAYGADETGRGWGENVKGCAMHDNTSKDYGSGLTMGDYIGCRVNLNNGEVVWYKNGKSMSIAYKIPEQLRKEPMFPTLSVKDGRVEFNFGDSPFVYPPSDSETWLPVCQAGETNEILNKHIGWKLNAYDATKSMDISSEGLMAQAQLKSGWQGSRCNKGVKGRGKYYYEAVPLESGGLARFGWSTEQGNLDLGTDKYGFGYGADPDGFGLSGNQGKKMSCNDIENYGKSFNRGDVIGCFLDLDDGKVQWSLNGETYSSAYTIPLELRNGPSAFFPAVSLKDNTAEFNFGEKAFKFYPGNEWTPLTYTPESFLKESRRRGPERKVKGWSIINADDTDEIKFTTHQPAAPVTGADNNDRGVKSASNPAPPPNIRLSRITDENEADHSYEQGFVNKTGTRTVTNGEVTEIIAGEPNVETESYINEQGNLVKRIVTRTKRTTKTTKTMSELVTERSENDVETTRTGKFSRVSRNENEDFDDELLRNAILAVTLMDSNVAVLNDYMGSLEFVANKNKTIPKVIESEI